MSQPSAELPQLQEQSASQVGDRVRSGVKCGEARVGAPCRRRLRGKMHSPRIQPHNQPAPSQGGATSDEELTDVVDGSGSDDEQESDPLGAAAGGQGAAGAGGMAAALAAAGNDWAAATAVAEGYVAAGKVGRRTQGCTQEWLAGALPWHKRMG